MWLEIDFNDQEFEIVVANHIAKILGRKYSPLADQVPVIHCMRQL
jgi:hypothetical protein